MNENEQYNPRILVVDDEQTILDEFREILSPPTQLNESTRKFEDLYTKLFPATCLNSSAASFDLALCRQGDEAFEKVQAAIKQNAPFAVAFIDVRMPPGPDGVWTAEKIRALDPCIQIVVVTAYSDIDPSDISRRVTPADKLLYLQKPFHPHEIRQFAVALASKWIAERQLQKHTVELTRSNEQLRREIAEHQRTEQKRQLLSRAIMSTEDCVYITDMDGKIVFVNNAFRQTYQYHEEEIIGKEDNILWAKNTPAACANGGYEAMGGWEVAFFHRRKAGEEFPVSLSKSEVRDENAEQVAEVVIARDISERMHVENALRARIVQLKKENSLKKEAVAEATRMLFTPLSALKDIIGDVRADIDGDISPELSKSLELAEDYIESASRAANSLDDMTMTETDKIRLRLN
jgi:PAS domain S-box-containing protein